jgi:hypothetical protein
MEETERWRDTKQRDIEILNREILRWRDIKQRDSEIERY